jgi:hypothetical protein
MSGYVFCLGNCIACRRPFTFNPHKVPSTSAFTGTREPVCQGCMNIINANRKKLDLPPFAIEPDAYEPLPERDL